MISGLSDKIFELVNLESLDELTELLIQNSSNISILNSTNVYKETPLHVASGKLNVDCIQLILEFGANPNLQDLGGKTPVLKLLFRLTECSCEACKRKAVRCINILGEFKADMNIEDGNGETPLHLCAEGQWPECASALLANKATVGMFGRKPMLTFLLERIPSVITSVFDRSIEMGSNKIHDSDFELIFDLGIILPTKTMMGCEECDKQGHAIKPKSNVQLDPIGEKYIPRREMGFLHDLVKSSQGTVQPMYTKILYHPLVHVFTDIKWKRLQLFYCFHLAVQAIFLMAYTLFLFLLTYYDCPYVEKTTENTTSQRQMTNEWKNYSSIEGIFSILDKVGELNPTMEVVTKCKLSLLTTAIAGFTLLCTIFIAATEMKQAVLDFKEYMRDMLNYAQWACIGAVLATILVALDSKSRLYFWVYPVAGLGMGMSWCQIFIYVGRLPLLSIYVEMFVKITLRFCWSLLIYSSILIAFALSYCILFPLEPKFVDIPLALIKMLTMMVGELDYNGLFSKENKSPITSHVWYALFIVLVTLILMNLLVGMAVNDIQHCRKSAELYVLKRRVRYLWFLEKSFFIASCFTPKSLREYLRKLISVFVPKEEQVGFINKRRSKALINGCYRIRPNDPLDGSLSRETKYCIKKWLEKRASFQVKEICKKRKKWSEKASLDIRTLTDLKIEAGGNVRKTQVYSTPPKLSWSDENDGSSQEPRYKIQFIAERMERKLEELDAKIEAFFRRFESGRSDEN